MKLPDMHSSVVQNRWPDINTEFVNCFESVFEAFTHASILT